MKRVEDWPERLIEYIASREHRPFKWGKAEQDCCSFANGAVIAMTGRDVMEDIAEYATAEEADLAIGRSLMEAIDFRLNRRESIGCAQRGDIGLALIRGREAALIVEGTTLVGAGARGLVRLPRSEMITAWAI